MCIVALNAGYERLAESRVRVGLHVAAICQRELSIRCEADPADLVLDTAGHDAADRHLVLGERARLVGADDGSAAEGLGGRKAPDQGVAAGHVSGRECEDRSHEHRQHFGNRSDDQGHRREEAVDQLEADGIAEREVESAEAQDADHEHFREVGDLPLQRSRRFLGLPNQAGNLAELGVLCGSGDDTMGRAPGQKRAAECHAGLVGRGEMGLIHCLDLLANGNRFPREEGFVGMGVLHVEEAQIRGDLVALVQQDDIPGHDLPCQDDLLATVPPHRTGGHHHPLERFQRSLRLAFLEEAEQCVQDDHTEDHGGIHHHIFATQGQRARHRRSRQEDVDEGVVELSEQAGEGAGTHAHQARWAHVLRGRPPLLPS